MSRVARAAFHLSNVVLIYLACAAIYSNAAGVPFQFDGRQIIRDNEVIRVTELDFRALVDAAFDGPSRSRPVATVSFALNYFLFRHDVRGYHAVNTLIHLANGVLVYCFALVTFRQAMRIRAVRRFPDSSVMWMSLFTALVFTAHPAQVQSVTYIVQRMTSMAVMFYLAALLLYVAGRRSRRTAVRWTTWGAGAACWALALGSKQIAATLPLVIFLYE